MLSTALFWCKIWYLDSGFALSYRGRRRVMDTSYFVKEILTPKHHYFFRGYYFAYKKYQYHTFPLSFRRKLLGLIEINNISLKRLRQKGRGATSIYVMELMHAFFWDLAQVAVKLPLTSQLYPPSYLHSSTHAFRDPKKTSISAMLISYNTITKHLILRPHNY